MEPLDLRGLVPAPVTPFTRDGAVDHAAIKRLGSWLGSFKEVKGLTVLGHAGEGTFMTPDEQAAVIESFIQSTNGRVPVIAGITLEGTKVAAAEAKRAERMAHRIPGEAVPRARRARRCTPRRPPRLPR